jgi:DHA2 family multidrug resistance protein-like MFS transporter
MSTFASQTESNETLPQAGRREWIGLAVLMLPTLLIAMDFTVLHLAVPSITRDLEPSSAQLLWIVDIYGFLIAGSLITMGTLGDRIGRRRLLMIGAAAFGIASTLAAFSPSAELLIASRALLGIAGATLMPSTMSLLRTMFPDPKQFMVAIGIWVSGFSAGSAIGPLLGGAMLEYFWWGSVFLLNVPVMAALLVLGPRLLPEYRNPDADRLDIRSAAQSLAAVLLMIYGMKRLAEDGVALLPSIAIAVGVAVGIAFVRRQQRLTNPLIDLHLFANRAFSTSVGSMTLGIFAFFGVNFFIAQYLQLVLGLSPFEAGLWTLPGAIAFIISSNVAPRLVQRVRPVNIVTTGWILAAAGLAVLTQVGTDHLLLLALANVLMAGGFGMIVTLVIEMIMSAAPPERAGAASALSETVQEFGGALGLAVLGSLGTAVYRSEMTASMPAGVPSHSAESARESLGSAVAVSDTLSNPLANAMLDVAQDAFLRGLHLTAIIGATAFVAVAFLVKTILGREGAQEPGIEPEPVALPRRTEAECAA